MSLPPRTRQTVMWLMAVLVGAAVSATAATGDSALVDAVKGGDARAVRALLVKRADVNAAEADGTTPLHWAARIDNVEVARLLLEVGADAGAANRYGVTPLQLAAINGSLPMSALLLKAGADPNAALPEGETVLMTAARTGRAETVALLLDHGADINAREQMYGETALLWAAAENHPAALQVLLDRGADVNTRSGLLEFPRRRSGQNVLSLGSWTPLMYAARQDAMETARVLVAAGADLNLVDPDGATALVVAIINAHYDFAGFLLEAGADPNVVDTQGMGALYAAIDMHRLAVGHGRPNPKPADGLDSLAIVRMLLDRKADPNARLTAPIMQRQHTFGDGSLGAGSTPFMRAAKSGDTEVLKLLLAAGADPTLTLPNHSTALMFAAGLGWRFGSPAAPSFDQGSDEEAIAAVRLLIDRGLDINAANDAGDTPLHVAVTGRSSEAIVRFLIEQGADLQAQNKRGQTPLKAATSSRKNLDAIAAILREAMGDSAPVESAAAEPVAAEPAAAIQSPGDLPPLEQPPAIDGRRR